MFALATRVVCASLGPNFCQPFFIHLGHNGQQLRLPSGWSSWGEHRCQSPLADDHNRKHTHNHSYMLDVVVAHLPEVGHTKNVVGN